MFGCYGLKPAQEQMEEFAELPRLLSSAAGGRLTDETSGFWLSAARGLNIYLLLVLTYEDSVLL